jgi:HSP20 family protein
MKLMKRNDDWGFPSIWEDFFNQDLFNVPNVARRGMNIPAVNISETEKDYLVELAAPGMKKNDFKINVERNVLTISSEMKQENKEEEKNFTRREYSFSSFERSFTLPEAVNQDKIDAKYMDGVLRISLPKKEEVLSKNKEIKIS